MAPVFQLRGRTDGFVSLWFSIVAGLALSLLLALPALAQEQAIPALDDWVVDTTGTFSAAQKSTLAQRLAAFEKSKGAQIFVLMIPTTAPEDIDQYTRRVYDQWKVGRKNIDDGVLLVVAKDDRRLRIEVGYGLEGAITDLQAGRIIRDFIAPYFMQDEYVAGINEGVDKIMVLVEGEELPPVQDSAFESDEDGPLVMLLPLAFFAFVLPPLAAALIIGFFSFFIFWSVSIAIVIGLVAFVISLIGKAFGAGAKGSSGSASSRGSAIGGLGSGGFMGGGGGGFGGGSSGGGGGASGGGGGSGGGGASGGW